MSATKPAKRKTKVKSLPNGQAAWECGACGEMVSTALGCCPACYAVCPELVRIERWFYEAVTKSARAPALWEELQRRSRDGAKLPEKIWVSDKEIRDALSHVLPDEGFVQTSEGSLLVHQKDGRIEIRLDGTPHSDPPDIPHERAVELARFLFDLPAPPAGPPSAAAPKVAGDAREWSGLLDPAKEAKAADPDVRNIPVELIDRFPQNPRDELEFDEASLRELGEEMRQRQVQACVVRVKGARFELIAGERRYRAAKLVKLPTLRCEVIDVDDAEAIWMCGKENESRKQWSPVAKARWYREMKAANKWTDKELAKELGLSQGQVTSTMGLLDLPDDWQRRLISQEISASAVRPLIPWAKRRPQVLEAVATLLRLPGSAAKDLRDPAEQITVREMEEKICGALEKCTRSMTKSDYWPEARKFEPSAEERKQLDVELLKINHWDDQGSERAWNVTLWGQLQKVVTAELKEKEAKKPQPKATKAGVDHVAQYDLEQVLGRWQAGLVASKLAAADEAMRQRFVLFVAMGVGGAALSESLTGDRYYQADVWPALVKIDSKKLFATLFAKVMEILAEDPGELEMDDDWTAVGKTLRIDFAKAFVPTAELLECFPLAELKKMPGALPKPKDKPEAIQHLLAHWQKGFVPKQVREILGLPAKD